MTATYRLFQLISPSLPVGAFSYSQGLEWAIECGWVADEQALSDWLQSLAYDSLQQLELPVLRRLYKAFEASDKEAIEYWCNWLYASRETLELRQEEIQRGRTMGKLLIRLELINEKHELVPSITKSQLAGFAYAGLKWGIDEDSLCHGYAWSWLENTVVAGVKMIPLGQTSGQKVLMALTPSLERAVDESKTISDDNVGSFAIAQAIASSCHETQYSRLFRS
ncbi:urease accessory protein UreF [Enterovibrio norvegicus FF-33]|uniref:urease accessory protein UreF n=1 Tax=Enterovibrio norvegicus TaxID=188144 RepID=UPI0002D5DC04|nr:urease accessory protein UreF [Enterovibrio norvegicus]OEE66842.1 urease accessory protein UreF [Enterovibrio norvegicus FF-33]